MEVDEAIAWDHGSRFTLDGKQMPKHDDNADTRRSINHRLRNSAKFPPGSTIKPGLTVARPMANHTVVNGCKVSGELTAMT